MKKSKLLLVIILLSGCEFSLYHSSSEETSSNTSNIITSTSEVSLIDTSTPGVIDEENWTYQNFFDPTSLLNIKIHISQYQLELIQNDYFYYDSFGSKSPIYRRCNVTFTLNDEVISIPEVGIRMKGNTSRRAFLDENGEINQLIHYKLSFNQTFDDELYYDEPKVWETSARKERKNRTFLGMEKLDLKWNKGMDSTYIKENYVYSIFRQEGIYAPNETLSPLNIQIDNGDIESLGLFYVIEAVDETFINRHFDESQHGGDLYKAAWSNCNGYYQGADLQNNIASTCIGVEDEENAYFPMYDLKTNKKSSDHSSLKNLLDKINQLDKTQLAQELGSLIDVNSFLMFEAIAYLAGNPDDMRNNANNYYIYFTKDENKAVFIPYDWDWSLGVKRGWNPTNEAMVYARPYTRLMLSDSRDQSNQLIRKTFIKEGISEYQMIYRDNLAYLLDSPWFKDDQAFNQLFTTYQEKYGDLVQPTIAGVQQRYRVMELGDYTDITGTDENITFDYYRQLKVATAMQYLDSYND